MNASADDRKLFAQERQAQIVSELSRKAKVYVNELAKEFDVTPATIRADLRLLESEGLLRRCHGGAIPAEESSTTEVDIEIRKSQYREQKSRIADVASRFVDDGDILLIDSGTTTRAFVQALDKKRNLTIITNDITIVAEAERLIEGVTLIMLGGALRVGFHCSQGPDTLAMVRQYSAPKLFMSSDAFSLKRGFTTFATEQFALKQALLEQSEQHYMLLDSSKIETNSVIHFAQLADYDYFITDADIPDKVNLAITSEDHGPELVIA